MAFFVAVRCGRSFSPPSFPRTILAREAGGTTIFRSGGHVPISLRRHLLYTLGSKKSEPRCALGEATRLPGTVPGTVEIPR